MYILHTNFIPFLMINSTVPCFTIFGHVGFKEGVGQHLHGGCSRSSGIKAGSGPGVNVKESETVACYSPLYFV